MGTTKKFDRIEVRRDDGSPHYYAAVPDDRSLIELDWVVQDLGAALYDKPRARKLVRDVDLLIWRDNILR